MCLSNNILVKDCLSQVNDVPISLLLLFSYHPLGSYSVLHSVILFRCVYSFILYFIDFSISNWLNNMGILSLENLKDNAKTMLIQQLGVDKFLQDTSCTRSAPFYNPHVNGWKNGRFSTRYIKKIVF